MKKEDLEKKFTEEFKSIIPEGVDIDISKVNFEGLNTFVNEDTNNVVASKKTEFMDLGRTNFLKEKGFDDSVKFDEFVTSSKSSEGDTQKLLKASNKDRDKYKGDFDSLTIEVNTGKEIRQLESQDDTGFRADPKYSKFNHAEIKAIQAASKASGTEMSFDDAAKGYYSKNTQYQMPIRTGSKHKTHISTKKDSDIFYDERYGNRGKQNKK